MEDVTLDLVPFIPERLLISENVTLVADQQNYSLTAEFLQVWAVQKNVSDESPSPIIEIDITQRELKEYVGQTDAAPIHYYRKGDVFYFVPTPSAAVADYATFWLIPPESAAMETAGPTYIPRVAHRLIGYKASELIGIMTGDSDIVSRLGALYRQKLERVIRTLGFTNQSQPKFLKGSIQNLGTSREKTSYDPNWG